MESASGTQAKDRSTPPVVWPVGHVATMLGVPAVTIRSWEARYGMAPQGRSPGHHRRYTSDDVARLRRMQRLIAAGTPAGDAARLSAVVPDSIDHQVEVPATQQIEELLAELEVFKVREVAMRLDEAVQRHGVQSSWEEVVAPAMRRLGDRFQDQADCTEIETLLADQTALVVNRYTSSQATATGGTRPVLLVCCPGERHWLPLKVLQGALLERGTPALLLSPELPADAVVRAVGRAAPRAVALWSLTTRPAQAVLRRRLIRRGEEVVAAGPGWSSRVEPLSRLDEAVELLSRR